MQAQQHDCSVELKKANLAVTPARIAAMQFFESHDEPIDAFALVENLASLGIDRVTAFRVINTFVEKGLLRKVKFIEEDKARYELTNRGDHHHFVCRNCGSVQDIKDTVVPNFIENLQKQHNFVVTNHSLELFGICANCQKAAN